MEASRSAVRAMIDHLGRERGLSRADAYILCSLAGDLKICEVVDAPNWIVGCFMPDAVFESERRDGSRFLPRRGPTGSMALGCCRTTSSARYRLEEKGSECPAPSRNPKVVARHEGTVESVYAGDSGVDRLKPNAVGLWGVIFVAVTGAAPISAMLFNVPFATGFGTGLYTPAAFLFATVILTLFSVGYVAMARKMRAAGGFYTFISHGLGRELGMATGICGALSYALFEVSLLGGFAYFASTNFNDWFGWEIPWIAFALLAARAHQRALLVRRRAVGEGAWAPR